MNLIQKVKRVQSKRYAALYTSRLYRIDTVHDSTPSIGHDCLGVQTKPWSLLRGWQNRQKSFAITGKRFSKLLSNLESWNGVITTLWLITQPDMTHAAFIYELMLDENCLQTTPGKSSTRRGKQCWKTNHYDYELQPLYNISLIRKIEKSWKR
jgi:hypothetical protein